MTTRETTLLRGADHYWDVVKDHIISGSRIGQKEFLLSGPVITPPDMQPVCSILLPNTHQRIKTLGIMKQDNTVKTKPSRKNSLINTSIHEPSAFVHHMPFMEIRSSAN